MTIPVPCVCAIDPGAHGAIAFLTDGGALLDALDMPSIVIKVSGKNRTRVVEQALALLIAANRPMHAFLEASGPRPTDGSQQAFGMGFTAGVVRGVLAGLAVPLEPPVQPSVWKRAMGLTQDKGLSRQRAMMLFPARADLFARVKDEGRAEAALLGLYGLRMWQRAVAA